MTEREQFEAWAKVRYAKNPHFWLRQIDDGGYSCHAVDMAWDAWQAATQRQQERIAELEALVKYLQQEVARVERNRDMWRSQCQHQANALASIRLERDAAIARATHKEQT